MKTITLSVNSSFAFQLTAFASIKDLQQYKVQCSPHQLKEGHPAPLACRKGHQRPS
jgi:hypothetical protein